MNLKKEQILENAYLLIISRRGRSLKPIKDKILELEGFYNGLGYAIPLKNESPLRNLVSELPVNIIKQPLSEGHSFESLRASHKSSFFTDRLIEKEREIFTFKSKHQLENLDEEHLENSSLTTEEREHIEELLQEKEKLKESLEWTQAIEKTLGDQQTADEDVLKLLKPSSEEEIIEEMQVISQGIYTGYDLRENSNPTEPIKIEFKGGAISVLAAPTSHGKTMSLINFALGALENHPEKSVYFFSYEESRASIMTLFINAYIGIKLSRNNRRSIKHYFRSSHQTSEDNPYEYFINGDSISVDEYTDLSTEEYFERENQKFFSELIDTGRLNIVYSDYGSQKLFEFIRILHEKKENLGLVCIDYMQLLSSFSENGRSFSRQEELKSICLDLKNCANDTGLPILVAAQFNREVQSSSEMHATKIGEAGDIERIANLIIGMWNMKFKPFSKTTGKQQAFTPKEEIYMEVLKGREIGIGHSAHFKYDGNLGRIDKSIGSGTNEVPRVLGVEAHL